MKCSTPGIPTSAGDSVHGLKGRGEGVVHMMYRPRRTEVRILSQIPLRTSSVWTFSLTSRMLKKAFLSALMRMMAQLSSAQIYACRNPFALNLGKHNGIQCSFPFKKEVELNTMENNNCMSVTINSCYRVVGCGEEGYLEDGDCVVEDE